MADPRSSFQRGSTVLLFGLVALAAPAAAHGQRAEETAHQLIRLKAYGMFSYVRPDYNGSTHNSGGTIGGNIDGFRILPRTEIGMDVRYTFSNGTITDLYYYGGGPRVSFNAGAFKPYADFLFGHGTGTFNTTTDANYKQDVSAVPTYGGGFDYQLTRSWAVRADIQRQRWRYGIHQPYFYPAVVSVGASYQFHFHTRNGPNL